MQPEWFIGHWGVLKMKPLVREFWAKFQVINAHLPSLHVKQRYLRIITNSLIQSANVASANTLSILYRLKKERSDSRQMVPGKELVEQAYQLLGSALV
jgi:hypothetical protein